MTRHPDFPNETLDLLVVGGGCVGTAVAMFAARAGLRTALVERDDFASGTTSASTELIHGGLQYLFRLKLRIVRQSNEYAQRIYRSVPHLCRPVPIIVPCYRHSPYKPFALRAVMRAYEWFNRRYKHAPPAQWLDPQAILEAIPGLRREGLLGGARYFEWWIDSARLCLHNALWAAEHGAWIRNHAEVVKITAAHRDEDGLLVTIDDTRTGQTVELRARVVVSAAGPWTDQIMQRAGLHNHRRIRPTRGAHLFFPRLADQGLMIPFIDGRFGVVLPRQETSMAGTTDDDYYGDLDDLHVTDDEVGYLLEGVQQVLPQVSRHDIIDTKVGVRPTIFQFGKNEDKVSRDHRVEQPAECPGLIGVYGGKLATHTLMAEDVLAEVGRLLKRPAIEVPRNYRLPGCPQHGPAGLEQLIEQARQMVRQRNLPPAVADALVRRYGTTYLDVLQLVDQWPELAENLARGAYAETNIPVSSTDENENATARPPAFQNTIHAEPVLAAEVVYAAQNQWAVTPDDVGRRTGLGLGRRGGTAWRERVARLLEQMPSATTQNGP